MIKTPYYDCLIMVRKDNKLGIRNIRKRSDCNSYIVQIQRNKILYHKNCKTLDCAIAQRDLMLSMFI